MTLHKKPFKIFGVVMAAFLMILLGVSTVFADTIDSFSVSEAPIYSGKDTFWRFSNAESSIGKSKLAPFEIELKLDKYGSVIPSVGDATVKGSVRCSQPAHAFVWGELERRIGRVTVKGYFYSSFLCDGKHPWKATVVSQTGPFVGGKAKVRANVYAYTDYETDSDDAARTIILKGGPPPRPYYSALLESPLASSSFLTIGILSLGLAAGLVLVIGKPEYMKRFWER